MTQIMSPSAQETVGITDGQIDKASDVLRAALRKYRGEFDNTEAAQQSVTAKELGPDLLAVFRKHYGRFSKTITRLVRVNRSRTPLEVLATTDRQQYTDRNVVATMPHGNGEEAKIVFFKVGRYISDSDLEKEFALRGLIPADPYSLAEVNALDPVFADEHPNGTHWKDADGKWCYVAFRRDGDERYVDVDRDFGWDGYWWFAGLAS